MQTICCNWPLTTELQKALFDHDVGSVVTLLTRLEPDHNGSGKFRFVSSQKVSCTDSGRHVKIVPTGMHKAVGGRIIQTGLFFYR